MVDKVYNVTPMPKPRMTRSDSWKQRACVLKYRNFKDRLRLEEFELEPSYCHILFIMPMPKSWSKKKKAKMVGMPHRQQNADIDNLCKGVMDAVFEQDGHVWDIRITKTWGYEGTIVVTRQTWGDGGLAYALTNRAFKKLSNSLVNK